MVPFRIKLPVNTYTPNITVVCVCVTTSSDDVMPLVWAAEFELIAAFEVAIFLRQWSHKRCLLYHVQTVPDLPIRGWFEVKDE